MHNQILESIGIEPVNIRYPHELDAIEGLVIPGGESTTMSKLMNRMDFFRPLKLFANDYPVLGTCAGLILMSEKVVDTELDSLGLLDVQIERNGYGRQINSNTINIEFNLNNINYNIPGSFIRAPRIVSYGNSVNVLAMRDETPIIVKNDKHMGIAFHPELDNISILHEYIFLGDKTNK
ncbi:pyridoxal 5'-phosphate synthase glutaminase subunit PdxT [bacterium]|nr:pyridoxal 5'-phosphate synthase glutaminase subunit PdxT [bacterium]